MGHLGPKELYFHLGEKIDGLGTRVPKNETLYEILKELYTQEEAEVVARMPYSLSTLERVAACTGREPDKVKVVLETLAGKGLVMDLFVNGEYHYLASPMVIGIFEFTMMRTRGELNHKKWAKLFNAYLNGDFYGANFGDGQVIPLMRSYPHEGTIEDSARTEILDFEKATAVIESHNLFSIGTCSCRHEKKHAGKSECTMPLNTCSTFGYAADYWIRNKLARKVSKREMLENLARSRELGLALCGDIVKKNVTFLCHCCKCCCNALAGISKHGYTKAVTTSNYIARWHGETCTGCGRCAAACPIDAIEMRPASTPRSKRRMEPVVDESFCLGCSVCAVKCQKGAMKLAPRAHRVLYPETVFERVILGNLERGTLQNQLFDDPGSAGHEFMRAFVGGFLKLNPVKRALMSEKLRSRFLAVMKKGVALQGKGWILDM